MERTERSQMDALLQRILREPSYASQLLMATAEQLETEPFFILTEHMFNVAAAAASVQVLQGLPDVVAEEAGARARGALPDRAGGRETCGDYAARLRIAALAL